MHLPKALVVTAAEHRFLLGCSQAGHLDSRMMGIRDRFERNSQLACRLMIFFPFFCFFFFFLICIWISESAWLSLSLLFQRNFSFLLPFL